MLNDTSQYRDDLQARLQLAVQWNRLDVVERVLASVEVSGDLPPGPGVLRYALQVAVEKRRVVIVRVLLKSKLAADENRVIKVDFLRLYATNHRIFRSSSRRRSSTTLAPSCLALFLWWCKVPRRVVSPDTYFRPNGQLSIQIWSPVQ